MRRGPDGARSTRGQGVQEPGLERAGRRFNRSARSFLFLAAPFLIVGVVLILIGTGWSLAFGAAAILLGCIPGTIGIGLVVSGLVSRWSARHHPYA